MKKPKLSIIMPVYNSEQYVVKSLNSFVPEMGENQELIIIDDNSKDGSLFLLEKYINENKDKRIILIKNDSNFGAGKSKNIGLEIAKGEFIGFIDSDDYVEKNYFNNMINAIESDTDIVVSDIVIDENNKHIYNDLTYGNVYSKIIGNPKNISRELLLGFWGVASACVKIFRREIIGKNRFSTENSDDILFTISNIKNSKKITYIKNNKYYYFQSPNSITRGRSFEKSTNDLLTIYNATIFLYNYNIEYAKIYAANILFTNFSYTLYKLDIKSFNKYLEYFRSIISVDIIKELFEYNIYLDSINIENRKLIKYIIEFILSGKNTNTYILYGYIKKERYKAKYKKYINFFKCSNEIKIKKMLNKFNNNKFDNLDFNPKISIIIPVYNGEKYIEESIHSALKQTYNNVEVIVVDDGSTDNTKKIVERFKDRIVFIKKENGGVSTALNVGIKNMTGEYFSWLSHDDLYVENKIERQVEFLKYRKNKTVVLFSNYFLIDEESNQLGNIIKFNKKMFVKKPEYTFLRGSLNGITMLIPKEIFDRVGLFNENLRCSQDYDMWIRIFDQTKFIYMNEVLAKTRIHQNQDTYKNPRAVLEGNDIWKKMIEKISTNRKIELEKTEYNFYYRMGLYLLNTPYCETLKYCVEKCKKLNLTKYEQIPLLTSDGKTYINTVSLSKKIYILIREKGIYEVMKIVYTKIRRGY